jgi:uncharacterized membrane protein YkvA (DUF1232 family)
METLLKTMQLALGCGTLLLVAFLILLALPNSRLRAVVMPVVSWLMVIACGCYVVSPVDVVPEALFGPFGLVDDIGAGLVGYVAYKMATTPKDESPGPSC